MSEFHARGGGGLQTGFREDWNPPGGYRADFRVAKCENPGGPGARRPRAARRHSPGRGGAKAPAVFPGGPGKPAGCGVGAGGTGCAGAGAGETRVCRGAEARPGCAPEPGSARADWKARNPGLDRAGKPGNRCRGRGNSRKKPARRGKTPTRGGPPRRKTRKTPGARGKKPGKPRETVSARDGFARPPAYAYARTCTRRRARRPAGAFCACI